MSDSSEETAMADGRPHRPDPRFAIITVRSGNGWAAPVVERVPGGWQSGAHHYADSEVLDVQELHLVAQDAAATGPGEG